MSEELAEVVDTGPEVTTEDYDGPNVEVDMEKAQDTISDALFGKTEAEDDGEEVEEVEEVAEKEEKEEKEEVEEVVDEKATKEPPQSWKKEMREFFNSADPLMQEYILQREDQMKEGLEKDRNDANLGRTIRDVMRPYDEMFQQRGIDSTQAVQNLLQNHHRLSSGTNDEKVALIRQLAQSYGIHAPGKEGEQPRVDPEVQNLRQEVSQIKQNLSASQERSLQEARERINTEVSAFADEHPLFEDLSEDIAEFIKVGNSLEEAYDKALWANPVTRQKELDRQNEVQAKETEKQAKLEAEKAMKAKSVNVKGRDTKRAPTAKIGTMEDTMRETFRKLKSGN